MSQDSNNVLSAVDAILSGVCACAKWRQCEVLPKHPPSQTSHPPRWFQSRLPAEAKRTGLTTGDIKR